MEEGISKPRSLSLITNKYLQFGSMCVQGGVKFTVWAPDALKVQVIIYDYENRITEAISLEKDEECGIFQSIINRAEEGSLYKYQIDNKDPFPDPASRFQPKGVHGPSQVVNHKSFEWNDEKWISQGRKSLSSESLVIYELHVGTFTKEGTFKSLMSKLEYLKELGIHCIELLPVADFPGQRNWGYDGVCLYSPSRSYGTPNDLRELINKAHSLNIGVIMDCVYNHLGPDGNYLREFSKSYFTDKHSTPWGEAVNIDLKLEKKLKGKKKSYDSEIVRKFFIENAVHWIVEYHVDGLRLDACHALVDSSSNSHFLKELNESLKELDGNIKVFAEDDRNYSKIIKDTGKGFRFDGLWADDFHHQMRVLLHKDNDGYFKDFSGKISDLADTIRKGWYYCGQTTINTGKSRGSDPSSIHSMKKFVYCLQNHDQVGNRAFGERLHHQISLETFRAASGLLLFLPQTVLLFMGQEFAVSSPFCFFTDHNHELGKLVTEGRRNEFSHFAAFSDPKNRELIPDPQSEDTFMNSKIRWEEIHQQVHRSMFNFYKTMIRIRNTEPVMKYCDREDFDVFQVNVDTIIVIRKSRIQMKEKEEKEKSKEKKSPTSPKEFNLLGVFHLQNTKSIVSLKGFNTQASLKHMQVVLTSDDSSFRFVEDALPPIIDLEKKEIHFLGPGIAIFKTY